MKNNISGLNVLLKVCCWPLFQVNKILIKPKQNPINKLPESPKYNFAGGKLKIKNHKITKSNTTDISVNLFWLRE